MSTLDSPGPMPTATTPTPTTTEHASVRRSRVIIAGGGVAALEALLALRSLAGQMIDVDLLCPGETFIYRPMLVAEAFTTGRMRSLELARIAADLGATLIPDTLTTVDPATRRVTTASGARHAYDALMVAIGARRTEWLPGGLTFRDLDDARRLAQLLDELQSGQARRLAFAAPPGTTWTLPLYELALLTAARVGELRLADVSLTVVTPEPGPLSAFGAAAGKTVHELLVQRGVRLQTEAHAITYQGGRLYIAARDPLPADAAITLPRVQGLFVPGLPHDPDGFLPVDDFGRVQGVDGVYAAGDGTAFPIKQGGLAAQQADAAAEAILAGFGAPIEPHPFRPILRGLLLTGVSPAFLRADAPLADEPKSQAAFEPLWSPTSKVAGRFLAPYLAERGGAWHERELADLRVGPPSA